MMRPASSPLTNADSVSAPLMLKALPSVSAYAPDDTSRACPDAMPFTYVGATPLGMAVRLAPASSSLVKSPSSNHQPTTESRTAPQPGPLTTTPVLPATPAIPAAPAAVEPPKPVSPDCDTLPPRAAAPPSVDCAAPPDGFPPLVGLDTLPPIATVPPDPGVPPAATVPPEVDAPPEVSAPPEVDAPPDDDSAPPDPLMLVYATPPPEPPAPAAVVARPATVCVAVALLPAEPLFAPPEFPCVPADEIGDRISSSSLQPRHNTEAMSQPA